MGLTLLAADKIEAEGPPQIRKSADVVRTLERAGFVLVRQKGSHAAFRKGPRLLTVPMGRRELAPGTLRAIIEQSGLPEVEFYKRGKR